MKSMRVAAAASALVIVVAYLAIPIDMKKIAIAMIAGVGLFASCLHILRYGRLIESYVNPVRPTIHPMRRRSEPEEEEAPAEEKTLDIDSSRHVA